MERPVILYHEDCKDGFAAAWCAWRRFGMRADYIPAQYGMPIPDDLAGRPVYILDFAFSPEDTVLIAERADGVVMLDHHKESAKRFEDAMTAIPNTHIVFDMDRSGARMAWEYFHFGEKPPWFIPYVEDRDLWRFVLPDSKLVNAYLQVMKHDFAEWDRLVGFGGHELAVPFGKAADAAMWDYIGNTASHAKMVLFEGHLVPVVNAARWHRSELVGFLAGEPLSERAAAGDWWKDVRYDAGERPPFAMSWSLTNTGVRCELRARFSDYDVGALASKFGGGGHKGAAGFIQKQLPQSIVDSGVFNPVAPQVA